MSSSVGHGKYEQDSHLACFSFTRSSFECSFQFSAMFCTSLVQYSTLLCLCHIFNIQMISVDLRKSLTFQDYLVKCRKSCFKSLFPLWPLTLFPDVSVCIGECYSISYSLVYLVLLLHNSQILKAVPHFMGLSSVRYWMQSHISWGWVVHRILFYPPPADSHVCNVIVPHCWAGTVTLLRLFCPH